MPPLFHHNRHERREERRELRRPHPVAVAAVAGYAVGGAADRGAKNNVVLVSSAATPPPPSVSAGQPGQQMYYAQSTPYGYQQAPPYNGPQAAPPSVMVGQPVVAQPAVPLVDNSYQVAEARRHLNDALRQLELCLRELNGARSANTVDIIAPRGRLLGRLAEVKQHQGLKRAQDLSIQAQRHIAMAESLVPGLPLLLNGQRLQTASFVGMLVFDGFLGDLHYRQMISNNIREVEKMVMAVKYAQHWLR